MRDKAETRLSYLEFTNRKQNFGEDLAFLGFDIECPGAIGPSCASVENAIFISYRPLIVFNKILIIL